VIAESIYLTLVPTVRFENDPPQKEMHSGDIAANLCCMWGVFGLLVTNSSGSVALHD